MCTSSGNIFSNFKHQTSLDTVRSFNSATCQMSNLNYGSGIKILNDPESKPSYHGVSGDICHRLCASFALIVVRSTLLLHCTLHSSSVLHQICNKMQHQVRLDEVQCHQRHARNPSLKSLEWHSDRKTYFHLIGWKTLFIMCAK